MPELPEVETIVVGLRPVLAGSTIAAVSHCDWPATLAGYPPDDFCRTLAGEQIVEVTRRAKYILLILGSGRVLAIHLRMTGGLVYHASGKPPEKTTRLIFDLSPTGQLHFTDLRKFGRVRLLAPPEVPEFFAMLGPEPLPDEFTIERFHACLAGRRGLLKPTLLDQRVLAGLGNIYADEALFRSALHPQRRVSTLDAAETAGLYESVRGVLRQGVANRGTSISDYRDAAGEQGANQATLQAYGQTGKPCSRCGTPIERIVVGGRGTHFCPNCQRVNPLGTGD